MLGRFTLLVLEWWLAPLSKLMSEIFRSLIGRGLANFGMLGTAPPLLLALGEEDDAAIVGLDVSFFNFV